MVLYWKRLCALCGSTPPGDENAAYPDLRNQTSLFEIARSFKVQVRVEKT